MKGNTQLAPDLPPPVVTHALVDDEDDDDDDELEHLLGPLILSKLADFLKDPPLSQHLDCLFLILPDTLFLS